jgi:hypothetical protein
MGVGDRQRAVGIEQEAESIEQGQRVKSGRDDGREE